MAIAIDASSPTVVIGSTTNIQTATFSPPAGVILVACLLGDGGRASWSVSNTVASLTWNTIFHVYPGSTGGSASAYYAYLPGGASNMAVSAAGANAGGDNTCAIKVYVVTGADTSTAVGATSTGGTTDTANVLSHTVVPQVANSLGIMVAEEFVNLGVSTSSNTTFEDASAGGSIGGGFGYRVMGAAGGTETFTFDAFGAAAAQWAWGILEIRSAPVVGGVTNSIRTHMTARPRASLW